MVSRGIAKYRTKKVKFQKAKNEMLCMNETVLNKTSTHSCEKSQLLYDTTYIHVLFHKSYMICHFMFPEIPDVVSLFYSLYCMYIWVLCGIQYYQFVIIVFA
jgi:hypothetical protein